MKQKLLLFVLSLMFFNLGCRKGEGDPLISFKSREARLVGVWEVDSWNRVIESNSSNNHQSKYSSGGTTYFNNYSSKSYSNTIENITGSSVIYTMKSNSQQTQSQTFSTYSEDNNKSGNGTIQISIEFEKDGNFKRTTSYSNLTFVNNKKILGSGFTDTISIVSTESLKTELTGRWEFLGGVADEYKNKERVILHILNQNENLTYNDNLGAFNSDVENRVYKDGEYTEIWELTTLKNKEIVFEAESYSSYNINTVNNENMGGTSSEDTYNYTSLQTGKISGKLKQ
jgi:hypothetical protein